MTELPIVDAHQHFWDLERNYLPWLRDEPMIPFRYGEYRALRRSYLPEDYFRDAAGHDAADGAAADGPKAGAMFAGDQAGPGRSGVLSAAGSR